MTSKIATKLYLEQEDIIEMLMHLEIIERVEGKYKITDKYKNNSLDEKVFPENLSILLPDKKCNCDY